MEGLKQWTTEEVIEDILLEIMIEYKMTDEVARHSIKETLQRFYHRVIVKRKLPQECIEIMNNASNTGYSMCMNPNELERYHIQAPQNEYVIYFYDTLAELNNQETKDKLLSHPDVRGIFVKASMFIKKNQRNDNDSDFRFPGNGGTSGRTFKEKLHGILGNLGLLPKGKLAITQQQQSLNTILLHPTPDTPGENHFEH